MAVAQAKPGMFRTPENFIRHIKKGEGGGMFSFHMRYAKMTG